MPANLVGSMRVAGGLCALMAVGASAPAEVAIDRVTRFGGEDGRAGAIDSLGRLLGSALFDRSVQTESDAGRPRNVLRVHTGVLMDEAGERYLPALGGFFAAATGGAASGLICGWSFLASFQEPRAIVYFGDTAELIPTIGGAWNRAEGINEQGVVVGVSEGQDGGFRAFRAHPGGAAIDLGTIGESTVGFSEARDVNADGHAVGWSFTSEGQTRAALFRSDGSVAQVADLGGPFAEADAINDEGVVVGWSQRPDGAYRAFRNRGGAVTDLGHVGGGCSRALDVNNRGVVVGWSADHLGNRRGFVWTDASGMIDLNTLVPWGAGVFIVQAVAINDSNQVACRAVAVDRSGSVTNQFVMVRLDLTITGLRGDLNHDGLLNGRDLAIMLARAGTADAEADLNGDGAVDYQDIEVLLELWRGASPSDGGV